MSERADLTREAQLDLFGGVLQAYCRSSAPLSNNELYDQVTRSLELPATIWKEKVQVGKNAVNHNPTKIRVRWFQQTLKSLGILERVPGERGVWRATEQFRKNLTPAAPRVVELAYSTRLGVSLWANCVDVFSSLDEPIHLVLTSPPYCIQRARAYGGVPESEYVDFVVRSLEPLVRHLARGASVALNVSNDVFHTGSPARSTYVERLTLAMESELGLALMDRLVWFNPSKAPGPIQYASKTRQQLNVSHEPILWFTNDPHACFSNNNRVLQPHTERHARLIEGGGEKRKGSYGDGANRIVPGAFGNATPGRIPRNVLPFGHRCRSQDELRRRLKTLGLPHHGATMPLKLARFLIEFLTQKGQLVGEPFGGWNTTGLAAELTGRRWISTERMGEYAAASSLRFETCDGYVAGNVTL